VTGSLTEHLETSNITLDISTDGLHNGGEVALAERIKVIDVAVPSAHETRVPVMSACQDGLSTRGSQVCRWQRLASAMSNAVAKGGGATFALLCDYIIVERSTVLSDGHIRAALTAGDGGTLIWPLAMGLTKAKRYLLTGDNISVEDAERFGLVTEVVEDGQSRARAMDVARRLADGPQVAIRNTKVALNQWLRLGQTTSQDYALALQMLSGTHDDVLAALNSLKSGGVGAIARET
jgi:Enoyl-CoA hydratase/isomerase